MPTIRLILILLGCITLCALACAQETAVYSSGAGEAALRFTVTRDGLSSITLGGREVANGGWDAHDAGWLYGEKVATALFTERRLEQLANDHVRVYHRGETFTTTCDYLFNGEDVHIKARVENNGDKPIKAISLEGLDFHFQKDPAGYLQSWDTGLLTRFAGLRRGFHPSFETLLGGSYAYDGFVGVGLSPRYSELTQTLFWWSKKKSLHYLVLAPIPAGGALTYEMVMRVSRDGTWKHLLEPYKAHFLATFGPVRYKADYRPFGQYMAADGRHGGPDTDNPSRWNWFRFDRAEGGKPGGMKEFAQLSVSMLQRANAQGIIVWCMNGYNDRANFRPDFDVFPPEAEANIPIFRDTFAKAGLKMGALGRPGEFPIPVAWGKDGVIRLIPEETPIPNPDQLSQLGVVCKRFTYMRQLGFSLFYLDTFGADMNDIKSMQRFREVLGPDVLTFSEFWTDVFLVYSGAYCQLGWNDTTPEPEEGAPPQEIKGAYREFWNRLQIWDMMRWLLPGVQAAAPANLSGMPSTKKLPEGTPTPCRFLYQHGITPMFYISTSSSERTADELKKLSMEFLDDKGQYKQ